MHIIKKFLVTLVALGGILTTSVPTSIPASAATKAELNVGSQSALQSFIAQTPGSRDLISKASAVLVFPAVIKAGLGIGGEYGEGAFIMRGNSSPSGYYNIVSASVGFQAGIQQKTVLFVFMTDQAVNNFLAMPGWKVGVDGSVAVVTVGAGMSIDSDQLAGDPIVAFIYDQKGLMWNLTLEGSKITRIYK